MIKISKNFLFNPAQIRISGIKCNIYNISKIIHALDWKWIVVQIDSLEKESPLLAFVTEQGLRCFLYQHAANYIETSVIIPYSMLDDVLAKAISENPENIFVFNLLDSTNWDSHFQHSFEKLVITGIISVFISISLDENALLISANKSLIPPQELYRKIKTFQFD